MRSAEISYNTNLASEYLMMSLLCRAGKHAYLSLGNKKGVDIVVKTEKGSICVIEVKGVNKNLDWIISNTKTFPYAPNLFYALVTFNGKINDINSPADVYLIPSETIFTQNHYKLAGNDKTVFLSHKFIRENYRPYMNTFRWLDEYLSNN